MSYSLRRLAIVFAVAVVNIAAWTQDTPVRPPSMSVTSGQQSNAALASAKELFEQGNVEEAERLTRSYLESHSTSADAHFLLGLIFFKQNKPKDSLAEYTSGARYRDPSGYDLEVVSLNYVLLGDYISADRWLSKSVRMDSRNWESWYYLGRTKYNENRFEEAVEAFQQALKLSPGNVKAEDNLGLCYAGLGQRHEAEQAYRDAVRWQTQSLQQSPGPYLNLGILLLEANRPQDAVPYLTQAVDMSPEDAHAHEYLGRAYEHLNRLPEAQTELQKAVEANPSDGALHYILGHIYQREGLKDRARLEFEKSASLRSDAVAPSPQTASSRH
jgi:Flp pilus assembly protein TadD